MYKIKIDKFDSKIFGIKTAKLSIQGKFNKYEKIILKLKNQLKLQDVKYAVIQTESSDFALIHSLEVEGFFLIDQSISLKLNLDEVRGEKNELLRIGGHKDIPKLKEIIIGLYTTSRIYNDVVLRDKTDYFYQKWVENSLSKNSKDIVYIYGEKDDIFGFAIIEKNNRISLVGISRKFQNKGLAKKMLNAVVYDLKVKKITKLVIDTQVTNIAALRVYQNIGFKIFSSKVTFRILF